MLCRLMQEVEAASRRYAEPKVSPGILTGTC
ncbi:hypothetical protein ABID21_000306 [Pseudorhizobium tarimense]|uniref:Uncharacterized protein n=1 Tax=Pseudorhizobium tarimense TaxID=1079109 RepID=A0ABV2H185_9HYPH